MAASNNLRPSTDEAQSQSHQPSEFELRRAALIGEIGESLEQVLTQMNALNRSLEGIIEIGNEFSSVEALWSQFETVMGRSPAGDENDTSNNNNAIESVDTAAGSGEGRHGK
ncbi:uncharacterized protein A1O5_04610 [Cladophialophora psammophila CBS 110553]|uniref:DASH complex subunit DAD1 n=1 Tax=Cladophialophora psammophila CBS 110553 TaxID=1182543 RepID=W9X5A1_9EURO|nr:uncharacterized protein A1O5_04610 [Cladophialophora psammophila CBS 110553]EXJ72106.1 hypothetical protein A1O5_04610 [Cladophialophora psammophila CBS 110553]